MANKSQNNQKPGPNGQARRRRLRAAGGAHPSVDASLVTALGELPDSRAGMVARGRQLARDPGYPTEDVIRLMSEILANHLHSDGVSY